MKNVFVLLLFVCGGLFLLPGCGTAETDAPPSVTTDPPTSDPELQDIVDTAVAAEDFETLVTAVKAAELVDTLKGTGPFTVFAPTDAAFDALPEGTLADLLKTENKEQLAAVLGYHVVSGKVSSADVVLLESARTVQGDDLAITAEGGVVKINGAVVTSTDIECSNGVIHVIDAVLIPPQSAEPPPEVETPKDIVDTAVAAEGFATLVAAVKAAGLVETLKSEGPFTVFAPTDAAFEGLPDGVLADLLKTENKDKLADILKYHVVSGKVMAADVVSLSSAKTVLGEDLAVVVEDGTVKINGATVTATDIECGNGVIHVIDAVLLPPQPEDQPKDIVDTAMAAEGFSTLVAAVQAAGLVETLKGSGPFTVFAPTDAAFAKLPEGTLDDLLKPENKGKLTAILAYHVVGGAVPAAEVVKLTGAKSVNGQLIDIRVEDGKVTVDQANVVTTDIACSNGVIHVIDQVILPAASDIPTTATNAENFKTLVAAAQAAGLVEALSGEGPFTVFAPTDEAFAKLPEGTVESLLKPENKEKLTAILKYHVVPGRVYATDALAAGEATTLQGDAVKIALKGEVAMVNAAKIVATDLDASNGVIHVIDAVLLPPEGE